MRTTDIFEHGFQVHTELFKIKNISLAYMSRMYNLESYVYILTF